MANFDWKNLPFGYQKTNYNVRCYWREGKWGELEVSSSETINLHMAATVLHYGQALFEGLKAFKGQDGKIRVFRIEENAKRLIITANRILMPGLPVDIFTESIQKVISLNSEFIPPYESGASLYIRPFLFGSGPQVGVKPANEFLYMVFVTPVGPYFKEGFKPTDVVIEREYDRAAPLGTGNVKVGGNYAAGMLPGELAHKQGYSTVLFLDAKEKKYIDECGPANFFGIKNNTYITPMSNSILPSITNDSLMQIALDLGMKVERRQILVEELETFEEVGCCGTAAVISPVRKIVDPLHNKEYVYSKDDNAGPISKLLYNKLRAIQYGDEPDIHGWVMNIDV